MKVRLYNQLNNSKYHPILSLKCAISGLFLAFKDERNLVVQLIIGVTFFIFNIIFGQYILAIANLVFTKPDFPQRKFLQKKASLIDRLKENLAYPETQLTKKFMTAAMEPHPYYNNYFIEPQLI